MNCGDFYSITYTNYDKKITATFYEENNGIYFFKNKSGLFGISKKAIESKDIVLDLVED